MLEESSSSNVKKMTTVSSVCQVACYQQSVMKARDLSELTASQQGRQQD